MGEIGPPTLSLKIRKMNQIYSEREISSWLKQYTKPQPSSASSSKMGRPRIRQLLQKQDVSVQEIVWL